VQKEFAVPLQFLKYCLTLQMLTKRIEVIVTAKNSIIPVLCCTPEEDEDPLMDCGANECGEGGLVATKKESPRSIFLSILCSGEL
jgi:hypothetical protein